LYAAAVGESGLAAVLDRVDKIADVVRDGAAESERLGHLAPAVVDALHESGLFRTFVPLEYGGLGLTIPEGVCVFERVSELDASTGWTLTILCSGSLFARFCAGDTFATICRDASGLIAGTLNPLSAQAEPVDGGFLFSGRATFLSGSAHARYVMASALVMKDQAPVLADGAIQIRSGFFPIEKARSLDTWNVTGMRATGSTDYELDGVMVATDWTFEPFGSRPAATHDVFAAIPLWSQLGGLAAVAVGAARNMIDRFVELAATKVPTGNFSRMAERAPAQIAVAEAEGLYLAAHAVLNETIEATWARGVAAEPFDNETLAKHRVGSVTAVRLAAQAIDLLHDAAGMNAVAQDSVLDRCWRDVHTMTQHIILSPARFEIAGRALLGLDPGSPVI
jgi:alkylation response protein AidB-like acyl-CoA dehydrogenase